MAQSPLYIALILDPPCTGSPPRYVQTCLLCSLYLGKAGGWHLTETPSFFFIYTCICSILFQVGLRDISYEQFYDLLTELFLGDGMTRERILVLFFFCSDLAIRTLRQQAVNIFQKCLEWSQRYIIDRVCLWVQQHGGWVRMFHSL